MAISRKVRKQLWAQSGNRCAMCNSLLVRQSSGTGELTVQGEECHIHAKSSNGPRWVPMGEKKLNSLENLILLCREHHREIDENAQEYSAEGIKRIKAKHERRVQVALDPIQRMLVTFLPPEDKKAFRFQVIASGREAFALVSGACAPDFECAESAGPDIQTTVGEVFDTLKDFGDMLSEIDYSMRFRLESELTDQIEELYENHWAVLGGLMENRFEAGGEIVPWPTAVIRVEPLSKVVDFVKKEG